MIVTPMSSMLGNNQGEAATPVVLLVFNRPEHTSRVMDAIARAKPSRLYVVADGPRPGIASDRAACDRVRQLVDEQVDWPCELIKDYAGSNLGCANRVSSGLTNVFRRETSAIVLEDDCLPDQTFFRFCEELLMRYSNDQRVGQISGCSFHAPEDLRSEYTYHFSKYPHCWGWATWRRSWVLYVHAMTAWQKLRKSQWLKEQFEHPDEVEYWRHAFDSTHVGKTDSWAYRWTLALWNASMVNIVANTNMVSNIGFDACATHTRETHPVANLPAKPCGFPIRHPQTLEIDSVADLNTSKLLFRRKPAHSRILAAIKRRVFK